MFVEMGSGLNTYNLLVQTKYMVCYSKIRCVRKFEYWQEMQAESAIRRYADIATTYCLAVLSGTVNKNMEFSPCANMFGCDDMSLYDCLVAMRHLLLYCIIFLWKQTTVESQRAVRTNIRHKNRIKIAFLEKISRHSQSNSFVLLCNLTVCAWQWNYFGASKWTWKCVMNCMNRMQFVSRVSLRLMKCVCHTIWCSFRSHTLTHTFSAVA